MVECQVRVHNQTDLGGWSNGFFFFSFSVFSSVVAVQVTVTDINDNGPIFGENIYTTTVPEYLPAGASAFQVTKSFYQNFYYSLCMTHISIHSMYTGGGCWPRHKFQCRGTLFCHRQQWRDLYNQHWHGSHHIHCLSRLWDTAISHYSHTGKLLYLWILAVVLCTISIHCRHVTVEFLNSAPTL